MTTRLDLYHARLADTDYLVRHSGRGHPIVNRSLQRGLAEWLVGIVGLSQDTRRDRCNYPGFHRSNVTIADPLHICHFIESFS